MLDRPPHRTRDALLAALPRIEAAPADGGRLEMIVVRPGQGLRDTPRSIGITAAGGLEGDHWSKGCWRTTEDGRPHPDVQVCIMGVRAIEAIAGAPSGWAAAGDNLFVDMDLSPGNLPPGTRVALGTVEMVITAEPHLACQKFSDRYGRDACVFVNTGRGRDLRLRGIYGRVTCDGMVSVGDRLRKV